MTYITIARFAVIVNVQEMTALMYSSKAGNIEVVKILLEKGADFRIKSNASILRLFNIFQTKF